MTIIVGKGKTSSLHGKWLKTVLALFHLHSAPVLLYMLSWTFFRHYYVQLSSNPLDTFHPGHGQKLLSIYRGMNAVILTVNNSRKELSQSQTTEFKAQRHVTDWTPQLLKIIHCEKKRNVYDKRSLFYTHFLSLYNWIKSYNHRVKVLIAAN